MKCTRSLLALICCICTTWSATAARAAKSTAMVVPVRYVVVQVAFDLASLDKGVSLVSYESTGNADEPALHIWDPQVNGWLEITMSEFRSGAVFGDTPDRVLIVGKDLDQMAVLATAAEGWPATVKQIESLSVDNIVNGADAYLNFTPYEWKWLAKRYQLELEDLNAERRRYGRYGKPGDAVKPPAADAGAEATDLDPLPLDAAEPVPEAEATTESDPAPALADTETAAEAADVDPADK